MDRVLGRPDTPSMTIEDDSMHALFWSHLENLRSSEDATRRAIEDLIDRAPGANRRTAMAGWLARNREQVDRLKMILEARPDELSVSGESGSEAWETYLGPSVHESGTVVGLLFLTRYKIAAYQAARQWAILLGYVDLVTPLQQSLNEEHRQAEELSAVQEGFPYPSAISR